MMFDDRANVTVARPKMCPFCQSKAVDTLAKEITVTTFWRCRACESTWTLASLERRLRAGGGRL